MFVKYHLHNPNSFANDVVVPSRVGSSPIRSEDVGKREFSGMVHAAIKFYQDLL